MRETANRNFLCHLSLPMYGFQARHTQYEALGYTERCLDAVPGSGLESD
jgi:hypothetical protein